MRKWMFLISAFFVLWTHTSSATTTGSRIQKIVFMRHGEKPLLDFGQLNCQGLNRILALPKVLNDKFGKPDYIFAPLPYGKGYFYYVRALATIEPIAIKLNMSVNTDYEFFEVSKVAHALLEPRYHSSLLFISWEHLNIVLIAKKIVSLLGADLSVPDWPSDEYDSLWVFTIDWNKIPPIITFKEDHQNLNNQSKDCKYPNASEENVSWGTDTFVFIPEAEPFTDALDQLSCKGLNRALALPSVLNTYYQTINQFVLPKPDERKPSFYRRAFMTIEPTIINRGSLFIAAGRGSIKEMVEYLHSDECLDQTTVITWPKYEMAKLVQALYKEYKGNTSEIPNPVPSSDSIYEIKVVHSLDKLAASFRIVDEELNDSPAFCP